VSRLFLPFFMIFRGTLGVVVAQELPVLRLGHFDDGRHLARLVTAQARRDLEQPRAALRHRDVARGRIERFTARDRVERR
jgi:hypothetical protein